ncbi:MAG: hypothetical protein BMS9Abin15_1169 [Gammaproteobacteria bacterium]|nr:MAG: hypothetical protein BMS9Abin15_1169 [Gammaproteobacteria bacterium]
MRRYIISLIGIVLAAYSVSVTAQTASKLYKWTDDEGNVHYGSAPPPSVAGKKRDILNTQGQTVDKISSPKTPKQLAEEERKQKTAVKQERARRIAAQRDRYILSTYKNESEITRERDRQLASSIKAIKALQTSIQKLETSYKTQRSKASKLERAGKTPSEEMKAELRSYETELKDKKHNLKSRQEQEINFLDQFDRDLKRFRELNAANQ